MTASLATIVNSPGSALTGSATAEKPSAFADVAASFTITTLETPLWSDQSLVLELLNMVRIVPADVLAQVAEMARIKRAAVVDVLFASGFLAQSDRRALLDAASAISSNWLYKPWALTALKKALSDFLPFDQVLQEMNLHPDNAFANSIVGDILIANQLISRQQFDQARILSLSQGSSLGLSLVRLGYLSITLYKAIIDGIARLRTGQISSVQLRQKVRNESLSMSESSQMHGRIDLAHSTVGFALYAHNRQMLEVLDLLIDAGCVEEMTVLGLFEEALESGNTFEAVWHDAEPVGRTVLNKAAQLVRQVEQGMHKSEAVRLLSQFGKARLQ